MKNYFKIMMALVVICLPFAFTSCGSDDDEGPKKTTYNWELINTTPPGSATSEVKIAAAQAEQAIDEALYNKFNGKGWTATKAERKFIVTGGTDITNDQLVKIAFNEVLYNLSASTKEALPNGAQVAVKRGKTTVDKATLN
ncbi:MAG: hypothetical protein IKT00_06010 [Prevotella sp.]|nr:hypothetical protein [Prevotella sp.]